MTCVHDDRKEIVADIYRCDVRAKHLVASLATFICFCTGKDLNYMYRTRSCWLPPVEACTTMMMAGVDGVVSVAAAAREDASSRDRTLSVLADMGHPSLVGLLRVRKCSRTASTSQ